MADLGAFLLFPSVVVVDVVVDYGVRDAKLSLSL